MTPQERQSALVMLAERIMNWRVMTNDEWNAAGDPVNIAVWADDQIYIPSMPGWASPEWNPDKSWADAGMLLEALAAKGYKAEVRCGNKVWLAALKLDLRWHGASSESGPAAIFAAALKVAQSMEVQGG